VSLRTAVDALQEQQRVLSLRLRRNAVQSSLEEGPDGDSNAAEPSVVAASPAAAESDSDAVATTTTAAASATSEPAVAAASSTAETSTSTTGGDERAQALGGGAPDEEGPSMLTAAQHEEEEEEETLALKLPPSSMNGIMAPEAAFSRLARLLEGPATIGVEQMSIVESIHECVVSPPALSVALLALPSLRAS
jgi:hypothetical protein